MNLVAQKHPSYMKRSLYNLLGDLKMDAVLKYEKEHQAHLMQQKAECIRLYHSTKDSHALTLVRDLNASIAASKKSVIENS